MAHRDDEHLDFLAFYAVDDAPVAGALGVEPLDRELERFVAVRVFTLGIEV